MRTYDRPLALMSANRGMTGFLDAFVKEARPTDVLVVDPEPGRAARLVERFGLRGDALETRGELVLSRLNREAVVVAATDDPRTNAVLWDARTDAPVVAQAVMRTRSPEPGLPGVVGAFSLLQANDRRDPVMGAVVNDFAALGRQRSSGFDDDFASASAVRAVRAQVGATTASTVLEPKVRLEAATPHRFVYRGEAWPLFAVRGPAGDRSANALAEEAAHARGLVNAAVFLRGEGGIDLVIVRRGRARARFPLFRPPPPLPPQPVAVQATAPDTLITD